jgi:hypothetical protein
MHAAARIFPAAAACMLILATSPHPSWAWGSRTHQIINRRAVEHLPDRAREAWSPLAAQLESQANDADFRKKNSPDEGPRHFIDIDLYADPPFDTVPRDRSVLEKERGAEEVRKAGVVPWAIEECYAEIVSALRSGDWSTAATWAADLGHYVADAHQPLHLTKNHDGQLTGNKGVHFRFEVTMLDRHLEDSMLAGPSTLDALFPGIEGGPAEMCFDWIPQSYSGIEAILAADKEARALDPAFGEPYIERLWEGSREVAIREIDASTRHFAFLLEKAWDEAGSPPYSEVSTREPAPLAQDSVSQEETSKTRTTLPILGFALGTALVLIFLGST